MLPYHCGTYSFGRMQNSKWLLYCIALCLREQLTKQPAMLMCVLGKYLLNACHCISWCTNSLQCYVWVQRALKPPTLASTQCPSCMLVSQYLCTVPLAKPACQSGAQAWSATSFFLCLIAIAEYPRLPTMVNYNDRYVCSAQVKSSKAFEVSQCIGPPAQTGAPAQMPHLATVALAADADHISQSAS